MPISVTYVDTFQTRFSQSFVNLTKLDSTIYPAVTTTQYQDDLTSGETLTAFFIYDQWALRTISSPLSA